MWVLLSTRLRTWLLLAVAVPVIRTLLHRANTAAQQRDSDGPLTAALGRADALLTKLERRRRARSLTSSRGPKGGWL